MVQHSGGWLSFTTYIMRGIDEDKCLVILKNSSGIGGWGVIDGLTDLLYGRPAKLPPLSVRVEMGKEVARGGVEHAIAQYRKWKAEASPDLIINEGELNMLGYELLWAGRVDDAVAMLRLVMEEYPGSANAYDSYGDALLAKGDTASALVNFKKCYAMDSTFTATKEKMVAIEEAGRKAK